MEILCPPGELPVPLKAEATVVAKRLHHVSIRHSPTRNITHSWSVWSVSDGPDIGAPDPAVRASPRPPLVIAKSPTSAIPTTARIRRKSPCRCPGSPLGRETSESLLLFAALSASHALFLLLNETTKPKANWDSTSHARVAAEACSFSSQPTDLSLTVTFTLLNLFLAECLQLRLPLISQMLRVITPARTLASRSDSCVVGKLGTASATKCSSAPACYESTRLACLLLEPENSFVYGVCDGRDPFPM